MKTLSHPQDQQRILARLSQLTEQDTARWGVMSVNQMVCHLNDAYQLVLEHKPANPIKGPIPPGLLKWFALKAPVQWPKGVPTIPEVKQGQGGSKPIDFQQDHAALTSSLKLFCEGLQAPCAPHAMFGSMSQADWMRWGYLHADHHLRQFGR